MRNKFYRNKKSTKKIDWIKVASIIGLLSFVVFGLTGCRS